MRNGKGVFRRDDRSRHACVPGGRSVRTRAQRHQARPGLGGVTPSAVDQPGSGKHLRLFGPVSGVAVLMLALADCSGSPATDAPSRRCRHPRLLSARPAPV